MFVRPIHGRRRQAAPRERDSIALVLAVIAAIFLVPGCATHIGTTAASFMQKVKQSPDPNIRHLAYAKLAAPNCYDSEEQKGQAASLLSAALAQKHEPIASRAVICRTLGSLGRPEGREALLKAAEDEEPIVRAEACRALGRVGKPEDAAVLSRHMTADTNKDCQIAAIEGLGAIKAADPNVEILLVDGMEDEDPAVRVACLGALRSITGKDLGVEAGPWRKHAQARLPDPKVKPR
jgi:HEAT repeat protein